MAHARVPITAAALAAALGLFIPKAALAQQAAADVAQVALDEEGSVRAATPEEMRALLEGMQDSLSQSDHGLTEHRLDDGTVIVDLQGRFESVSVARIENGKVETRCATSAAEAEAFIAPATALTAAEE